MSTDKSDSLKCEIIHDNLTCENYHFSKAVLYIINRKIHGCLEIPDLFIMFNMISHMFAALTHDNTRNKSGISAHPCIMSTIVWPLLYILYG